jgi:signal transduction histidine kinase/ligand-binding sensor domain-containing protein
MTNMRRINAAFVVAVLLLSCPSTFALNPELDISQYAHTSWLASQGFFSVVRAITQTQDGYLWLGTELGLIRFDGVRAVPWTSPPDERLPSSSITSLLGTRDGALWIGTVDGLARWQGGTLTHYEELASQRILSLAEDRNGNVWAGTFRPAGASLCEIRDRTAACVGRDGTFGPWVRAIYEDTDGRLWVEASSGLWRWTGGPRKQYPIPIASTWSQASQPLVQGDSASALILIAGGLRSFVNEHVSSYAVSGVPQPFTPLSLLRTRDGALWIGTLGQGLVRVAHGRVSAMARRAGLSSDHIYALFEDREGNVWVGTDFGVDRFSELVATPTSVMSSIDPTTVLAAHDGTVWMGTLNGLHRLRGPDMTTYRDREGLPGNSIGSLVEDDRGRVWVSTEQGVARFENGRFHRVSGVPAVWVNAMTPDGDRGLWISDQDRGLLHVIGETVVEGIPWSELGGDGVVASTLVTDQAHGGVWLGFFRGGVAHLKNGQVQKFYGVSDGLGGGRVMGLHLEPDGTVWAATEHGLSRIADGRVVTLTAKNGLPCETIQWMVDDERASYWLYTVCGLVQIPRLALQTWVSDSTRKIEATVFDASDGVRSRALMTGFTPRVSRSSDGRLWFVNVGGVSTIDPLHLPINTTPPAVHIEQIVANQSTYVPSALIHLPGSIRDLEFDYTALSLVAPEKNRFRYKLEGWDSQWQDVGGRRQAFYANLPPRSYRFRVMASNNRGIWNESGASLDLFIAPTYYQTMWFRTGVVFLAVALLWIAYLLRLRRLAAEFDARLQERLKERTRIARDLHDTLLQSFHGIMFRLQAVRNMLPGRTEQAIFALDTAILKTEQAIADGRDAIQDLRSAPSRQTDLGHEIAIFAKELGGPEPNQDSPTFRVTVEGEPQLLSPILHDEVCRIARELVRNAFRHARARRIEADIRYDPHLFCLRIRDDGTGIAPNILHEGERVGHWGLRGIRERAHRIGAQLDLWSDANTGTEVQLQVPAAVAYDSSAAGFRLKPF